jgi:hypothetical protein
MGAKFLTSEKKMMDSNIQKTIKRKASKWLKNLNLKEDPIEKRT